MFDQSTNALLSETPVSAAVRPWLTFSDGGPNQVAYCAGEVTLSDVFSRGITPNTRVRVEIRPEFADGTKYWGFASITSSTTSQVTLVTPQ